MAKRSPYSEMYLVSPAIYQRMLRCLDRSDLNVVEELNQPTVLEEQRTPSERLLEQIHAAEINPQASVQHIQEATVPLPINAPVVENYPMQTVPDAQMMSVNEDMNLMQFDPVQQPAQEVAMQPVQNVLPIAEVTERAIEPMTTVQAPPLTMSDQLPIVRSVQQPLRIMSMDEPMPAAVAYQPSITQPGVGYQSRLPIQQQQQSQQQAIAYPSRKEIQYHPTTAVPNVSNVRQETGGVLKITKPCSTALCRVENTASAVAVPIQKKIIYKTKGKMKGLHICPICNREFTRSWNLTRHVNAHKKTTAQSEVEVSQPIEEDESDVEFETDNEAETQVQQVKPLSEFRQLMKTRRDRPERETPERRGQFKIWELKSDRFGNVRKRNQPEVTVNIRKDPYAKKPSFTQWREREPSSP